MKLLAIIAGAVWSMSCCVVLGWFCCAAYRHKHRPAVDAQTSDRTPTRPRLTPSQHTLQVRMAADAREASLGLFDREAWEVELRRRATP